MHLPVEHGPSVGGDGNHASRGRDRANPRQEQADGSFVGGWPLGVRLGFASAAPRSLSILNQGTYLAQIPERTGIGRNISKCIRTGQAIALRTPIVPTELHL